MQQVEPSVAFTQRLMDERVRAFPVSLHRRYPGGPHSRRTELPRSRIRQETRGDAVGFRGPAETRGQHSQRTEVLDGRRIFSVQRLIDRACVVPAPEILEHTRHRSPVSARGAFVGRTRREPSLGSLKRIAGEVGMPVRSKLAPTLPKEVAWRVVLHVSVVGGNAAPSTARSNASFARPDPAVAFTCSSRVHPTLGSLSRRRFAHTSS